MLWPSTLVFVTLFETLHGGAKDHLKETRDRMRFFSYRYLLPSAPFRRSPSLSAQLHRHLRLAIPPRRRLPHPHFHRRSLPNQQSVPPDANAGFGIRRSRVPGLLARLERNRRNGSSVHAILRSGVLFRRIGGQHGESLRLASVEARLTQSRYAVDRYASPLLCRFLERQKFRLSSRCCTCPPLPLLIRFADSLT